MIFYTFNVSMYYLETPMGIYFTLQQSATHGKTRQEMLEHQGNGTPKTKHAQKKPHPLLGRS